MGCLHSKNETSDIHPHFYRVVNIDENGVDLCAGQLEITETDIILYREGRDSTVWPLHSLRRYGFEAEVFSFESGRRCETGEGIYAFKCKRAATLFRNLQQQIQSRNIVHNSAQASRLSGSPSQARQTLQASVTHRSSVDNGQIHQVNQHPNNLSSATTMTSATHNLNQPLRSSSSADILEVMPLNPRGQFNASHVTNVYQLRDFKREHNNNTEAGSTSDSVHLYSNDLNRDLAILRTTLHQKTALNTMRDIEDENRFLESRYMNENIVSSNKVIKSFSPTLSNNSENYAQLTLELDSSRLYMNIVSAEKTTVETNRNEPTTPLTPKQVEYSNLSIGVKPELNSYANLALGEIVDKSMSAKPNMITSLSDNKKFSESDTFTSLSPVDELEVNYAVLDIESNKEPGKLQRDVISPESWKSSKNENMVSNSTQNLGKLISQGSIDKTNTNNSATAIATIGYTTIDFDKTVALTSVAAREGSLERKTRHNSSNFICGSPGTSDKNKAI